MSDSALFLLLVIAASTPASAQSTASVLKIPVGARAVGMGSAFTSVANDASAMYWNQAGLAGLARSELMAAHTQLFTDMRYDALAYAHPTEAGTIGVSLGYFSKGAVEGRDDQGMPTGNFTGSDMIFGLGFGRSVGNGLSAGVGVKYIKSSIADMSGSAFAADVGGLYRTSIQGLSLGFSVQNLGSGIRFMNETDPLPLSIAGGASYLLFGGLLISSEVRRLVHEDATEASVGAEYSIIPALSLRGGYLATGNSPVSNAGSSGLLSGIGAGLGLNLGIYRLDYAITPFGDLGNVQRVSLGARF